MLLSHSDLLADSLKYFESPTTVLASYQSVTDEQDSLETWEAYHCWKEQSNDRFGGGTPAPSIPHSQRQFDGDNWLDYCEPWAG